MLRLGAVGHANYFGRPDLATTALLSIPITGLTTGSPAVLSPIARVHAPGAEAQPDNSKTSGTQPRNSLALPCSGGGLSGQAYPLSGTRLIDCGDDSQEADDSPPLVRRPVFFRSPPAASTYSATGPRRAASASGFSLELLERRCETTTDRSSIRFSR